MVTPTVDPRIKLPQAKGREFLGRCLECRDRDAPTSDAARDAHYDAVAADVNAFLVIAHE